MGKTTQPLTLMMDLALSQTPEVQELRDQGHTIVQLGDFVDEHGVARIIDGYLGAKMWRMPPELIKYLPMAIKAIRKEKNANKPNSSKAKSKKAVSGAKKGKARHTPGSAEAGVSKGGSGWAEDPSSGTVESNGN